MSRLTVSQDAMSEPACKNRRLHADSAVDSVLQGAALDVADAPASLAAIIDDRAVVLPSRRPEVDSGDRPDALVDGADIAMSSDVVAGIVDRDLVSQVSGADASGGPPRCAGSG